MQFMPLEMVDQIKNQICKNIIYFIHKIIIYMNPSILLRYYKSITYELIDFFLNFKHWVS